MLETKEASSGRLLVRQDYSREEIIRLNDAAEVYFRSIKDPSFVLNKPLSGILEAPWLLFKFSVLLAGLDVGVGHTVLDFGAGTCWVSSMLNRMGCRTVALDVSATALGLGRKLFEYDRRQRMDLAPEFLVYDGFTFPLNSETIDRVFCLDAFHHVPNKQAILDEMFRVLKWGGRVGLSEPGANHSKSPMSVYEMQTHQVLESDIDMENLIEMANRAGFQDIHIKPYPPPESIELSVDQYRRFVQGDYAAFPVEVVRKDTQNNTNVILVKGHATPDSRRPHILTALLTIIGETTVRLTPNQQYFTELEVQNTGDTIWRAAANKVGGFVTLGAHLADEKNSALEMEYGRAPLPNDVKPGERTRIAVMLVAPPQAGKYHVEFDMVCERVCWFRGRGSPTVQIEIEVL